MDLTPTHMAPPVVIYRKNGHSFDTQYAITSSTVDVYINVEKKFRLFFMFTLFFLQAYGHPLMLSAKLADHIDQRGYVEYYCCRLIRSYSFRDLFDAKELLTYVRARTNVFERQHNLR